MNILIRFLWILVILQLKKCLVWSCSPGPRYGYRHNSYFNKLTPMVLGQYLPAVSETTLGASGSRRIAITRGSGAFAKLLRNLNTDIEFSDEEADGSDRYMTQRCKDRLDTLATLVINRWPGVRVRVTEAWESANVHAVGSLHYEGRAVDLTTSDRDTSKYGMLARLAVEAGFDWVHYKSKYFIHASVRADEGDDAKRGGCFPGCALLQLKNNHSIRMQDLAVGDQVLAVDRVTGQLVYSDVIMMLDQKVNVSAEFLEIATAKSTLTLTRKHLLFVVPDHNVELLYNRTINWSDLVRPILAKDVRVGEHVLTRHTATENKDLPSFSRVISIKEVVRKGVFAPLTSHGTVVVGNTVASCYSDFTSEGLAHASFLPARIFKFLRAPIINEAGIHWYAQTLIWLAEFIFPSTYF